MFLAQAHDDDIVVDDDNDEKISPSHTNSKELKTNWSARNFVLKVCDVMQASRLKELVVKGIKIRAE